MPVAIVGVGASAGGIEAFSTLLGSIPADTGLAFVFVLHMAASHQSMLAEILSRQTRMRVSEARHQSKIEPNEVYVIPPGRAMEVKGGVLTLSPEPRSVQHRSIDHFFTSLAVDQGQRAIGVILSGMARDGTHGLQAIKAAGGITFAQDPSAQHPGMPDSAIDAGCVDFVLSPAEIAREIQRLRGHGLGLVEPPRVEDGDSVEKILALLREATGADFTQYKSNSLQRRIRRRMLLLKLAKLSDYAKHLEEHAKEIQALYQDILIGVTSFFRDPEAFDILKTRVFPGFFKGRSRQDPLRVWVLGCSTGEEAYSIAIALKEYAEENDNRVPLCVYATDLNAAAVDKARTGLYPKSIAQEVSAERLRRYFVEADGGYRIAKAIREICVFAHHNALADPPFSRMDLISCRNVLIYMEPVLQSRLMPILHYALKPAGFLFLGPSESMGATRERFDAFDTRHKLFRKIATKRHDEEALPIVPRVPQPPALPGTEARAPFVPDRQAELQREAERVLFTRYVPVGVLVDGSFSVVQYRGDTGMYLTPAPGRASHDVLKMAREGLLLPLRSALQRARKDDTLVHESPVRVRTNGGFKEIALTIVPVKTQGSKERSYWVLFESEDGKVRAQREARTPSRKRAEPGAHKDAQIEQLTGELAATREYLQSVIEEQEAANEELQSANEEVQSANEELQSINEELETSKEEIQSSNEELTTVNQELQNRNDELNRTNSDLNNVFGSAQMAIVMVWRDLRIRRFTPLAQELFNLIPPDVGRPISDIKMNLDLPDLRALLTEVMETTSVRELEVRDTQDRWHLLRVRPYRTLEDKIDGAVIALVDIDSLKQNQEVLARQAKLLEQTHEAIFVRERGGKIIYWNRGAERLHGYSREEAQGRLAHELLGSSTEELTLVREALNKEGLWLGELVRRTREGREIVMESEQTLMQESDRELVLVVERDITERKHLEQALHRRVEELAIADRHKNEFLAMLAHELRNPLAPLRNAIKILRNPASSTEEADKTRDLIERQIMKMSRLVDDLLDAARITRRQVQLRKEPVDLYVSVQRAAETTRDMMQLRDQRLTLIPPPEPVMVDGDPVRLEQVFGNLLNNAAKYTGEKGSIEVSIEVEPGDAGSAPTAIVRVRDDGVGIAPDMLPRVFELFMQADRSLARTQGGLGIGLSLARSLVELHGGRITVHSEGLGRGSEFCVWLPILGAQSQRWPVPEEVEDTNGGTESLRARIVVVDDNPDIVESTSLLLRLQGHDVRSALNGTEALELAASFQPNIMLLDIGMPDISGYELAPMIRELSGLEDVVLVAMSGYGSDEDRARARACGFDHHLTKPVDPEYLGILIASAHSQPRLLKSRYGTKDDAAMKPSAAQGPHGA